jgi:hypothetical protein
MQTREETHTTDNRKIGETGGRMVSLDKSTHSELRTFAQAAQVYLPIIDLRQDSQPK